jgi:hypothetical protein
MFQETKSSKDFWPNSYPSPTMPSIFEARLKIFALIAIAKAKRRGVTFTDWTPTSIPALGSLTKLTILRVAASLLVGCFLLEKDIYICLHVKVYSMRVPSTISTTVAVSIIHHIRVEGGKLISANGAQGGNKEQIFGFVGGFDSTDI